MSDSQPHGSDWYDPNNPYYQQYYQQYYEQYQQYAQQYGYDPQMYQRYMQQMYQQYPQYAQQYAQQYGVQPTPPQQKSDKQKKSKLKKKENKMKVWGNKKTMNLPELLLVSIQSSKYFKEDLYALTTFHEVINEIIKKVKTLEPFYGAQTNPSQAFILLYKLFTLKLTRKQLNEMLKSKEPFVKAMVFLYVRFCVEPKEMFAFFEPHLNDEEEFNYRPSSTITMGEFAQNVLLDQKFLGTTFPRIPVPIFREFEKRVKEIVKNNPKRSERRDDRRDERRKDDRKRRRDDDRDDRQDDRRDDKKQKTESPKRDEPKIDASAFFSSPPVPQKKGNIRQIQELYKDKSTKSNQKVAPTENETLYIGRKPWKE